MDQQGRFSKTSQTAYWYAVALCGHIAYFRTTLIQCGDSLVGPASRYRGRRHRHAHEQALAWVQLGDDPARFLLAGPDSAGNLLELVVLPLPGPRELVIHAMKLRRSTADELFGGAT